MSESNAGSAAPQESSGSTEKETLQDKVAYETYRRVLAEAKKYKDQAKLLEDEKNKNHESKLKENNEWKALAEAKAAQVESLEKAYREQNEQIVNGMKYQQFEKHLGGKLKDQDYVTFIDFDKIVINPETKRVDDESVKGVVSEFVKRHAHLVEFQSGKRMPNEAAISGSFSGEKNIDKMNAKELEEYIKSQYRAGLLT
jgi:4-alpha-glucanotransferase